MDLGLEGKAALVTAASKGLGRAIATELAREGVRVVISSRDEEALSQTAAEIGEETGAEVDYRAADLTSAEEIRALVAYAAERFGGVDVLVNNTGGRPQAPSKTSTTRRGRWRSSRSCSASSAAYAGSCPTRARGSHGAASSTSPPRR